ncbi:MAG TPA: hypothetical protein VFV28_00785 [Limnobacter sp.]|nr:hypothetical protein [Limnobacter sp.]
MNDEKQSMMKQPWMWLVLGLPASVVLAGFATLAIAMADPEATQVVPHKKLGFTVEQNQSVADTRAD